MRLHRQSSEPTDLAPEQGFIGRVVVNGYFRRREPSRLAGAVVTYPPGARSPWKVNPAGQTVVVTSGRGWVQTVGDDVMELRAGDIAWFGPGEQHREGATPSRSMTAVVLHEATVEFLDRVTDEQYLTGPPETGPAPALVGVREQQQPGPDAESGVRLAFEGARR